MRKPLGGHQRPGTLWGARLERPAWRLQQETVRRRTLITIQQHHSRQHRPPRAHHF